MFIRSVYEQEKKLFCAFIDYKKAFDSVDRVFAFGKNLSLLVLLLNFVVLFNMYKHAKSYVRMHESRSNLFSCLTGVRLKFCSFIQYVQTCKIICSDA